MKRHEATINESKNDDVRTVILEMAGGSREKLVAILLRLREENPAVYRAFVAGSCMNDGSRAEISEQKRRAAA